MGESPLLWVPAGHFYSPLVDPDDVLVRTAIATEAEPTTPLSSLGIDETEMWLWFERMGAVFDLAPFPAKPQPDSLYYYENPNFPLADALALYTFLRHYKPKRFVEVGSGFSSCVALDVRRGIDFTFIEPFPGELPERLRSDPQFSGSLIAKRLQDVDTGVFTALEPGDVLFLDSSHVAKTGSDVVDYLFRIFPVLRSGVLVHVHDIFYPFEYPHGWIVEQNRSWNEAYFLRAYLADNPKWKVLFFFDWFFKCRRDALQARMPDCVAHRGGSLWLTKR